MLGLPEELVLSLRFCARLVAEAHEVVLAHAQHGGMQRRARRGAGAWEGERVAQALHVAARR